MWFVLGVVMGLSIGGATAISALTAAPRIVGGSGYLSGYEVVDDDGDEICTDPYVWTATREIECD